VAESTGIEKYVRPDLGGFTGYSASVSPDTLAGKLEVSAEDIVKLNANENPYGCSPKVLEALAGEPPLHVYPDNGQSELRRLLEGYIGVDAGRIVAGHGSNTLIDMVVRLFVGPGDEVIDCIPTFDIYRFSTQICGGRVVNVPRDDSFAVNVKAVKAAVSRRTKLICLATPNNPTGNTMPRQDILDILGTGLPVLVDEAYYEFCGETVLPLVGKYENLMVLRSFSKWAGLAGLRVGYGIFPPRIASRLMAIKIPHNISVAAEIAVRESLEDIDYLMDNVEAIVAERERLFAELGRLEWLRPFPSRANFILCRVLGGSARELYERLQQKGILVRYFDKELVSDAVRISAGKPEHTDALMKALGELEV
jgi:histidinol-phosphate aminotransferase